MKCLSGEFSFYKGYENYKRIIILILSLDGFEIRDMIKDTLNKNSKSGLLILAASVGVLPYTVGEVSQLYLGCGATLAS